MKTAIIDQHIGWYGSINLIGRTLDDTTVIRMDSSDLENALMDALSLWNDKKTWGLRLRSGPKPRHGKVISW